MACRRRGGRLLQIGTSDGDRYPEEEGLTPAGGTMNDVANPFPRLAWKSVVTLLLRRYPSEHRKANADNLKDRSLDRSTRCPRFCFGLNGVTPRVDATASRRRFRPGNDFLRSFFLVVSFFFLELRRV